MTVRLWARVYKEMEWSQEEERALLSREHIRGPAPPAMGSSFSLHRVTGNDRKWKLPLPLTGTGASYYAGAHIWTSHTPSLWKKYGASTEKCSRQLLVLFSSSGNVVFCVKWTDTEVGLFFFSWLEKGGELIRENLENTKHQKSRTGITEKTILQRLLLFIWASFQSLGQEDPLEKEMATHSSVLAWRIPRTEEPDRLQSMGLQRVRHDWVINTSFRSFCCSVPKSCLFVTMDCRHQASLSLTISWSLLKFMLRQWRHPTISSSVAPFSSCPQSFPASGSFPMSQLFTSSGQSIGASASASVLLVNIQDWLVWFIHLSMYR